MGSQLLYIIIITIFSSRQRAPDPYIDDDCRRLVPGKRFITGNSVTVKFNICRPFYS